MEIRNIAIIAHVDHGKTTLTDALLRQCGMVKEGVSLDSNALEIERGITIYSKNASLFFKDIKINIVDTPGHADFGSEVERVLRSIDAVLLVVDAQEGPMPQTRFVLKKSLEVGIKPILVINKIDKPAANPERTHEEVLELFMDLGASDEQLNFTTVYAIGREGVAKKNLGDESKDLTPLLDTIIETVKPARADATAPLRMQPFNLAYDNYLGRMGICRIYEGTVKMGQNIFDKHTDGSTSSGRVTKLYTFSGLERVEVESAQAGDIIMIAGIPDIYIGDTICDNADAQLLPSIKVDEPTISVHILVNDSPFAGREGKLVTSRQIRERLERELEVNVGLRIDFSANEYFLVYGRGELHIAILLETMRREGYELQASQPHVIFIEKDGKKLEPFEEVIVDCPENSSGVVIEALGKRKGVLKDIKHEAAYARLTFDIPTRGLLGYRNQFIVDMKGEGTLASRFIEFRPSVGDIDHRSVGSMISMATGKVMAFSLDNLQLRGQLYIGPNIEVYEGMVIGNTSKGTDMPVNPTKGKNLTNVRASAADEKIFLEPPLEVTLERGLEIMADDEYLEVTPKSVRLRKQFLTEIDRARAQR